MGYSKKSVKMEGEVEAEGKKWLLTALTSPLKPIHTKKDEHKKECGDAHDQAAFDEEKCTTPSSDESRIPSSRLSQCPGAPRKRKSCSRIDKFCGKSIGREFFSPPELESLFMSSVDHQRSKFS
ncbi:hypothetical protein DCAR_0727661 [Daucus carota subsp. sativus]|uniref:Uncharacterized protein n=2 Tax=Daucus carota subsp. sativus TaxID=79200 RepID=A0AAF1B6B9_DAUCS|nr:PREDICTED: uncharacterized protein LOC108195444 [Daucus carota subsp. sativus]WOH08224.1 hypothetical protein DCAR_0727661 [Daucus carota subsp. sativus]